MSDVLKLKYKVGKIEFEAEGPADAVEAQRINFINVVLPAAVEAMGRTQVIPGSRHCTENGSEIPLLESGESSTTPTKEGLKEDYSRTNLPAFLKKYGTLSDQDFTLFAAHFDEVKNGIKAFSIDNVKKNYQEGRRPPYSNYSALLQRLAQKGFIMDTTPPENVKSGNNYYMLTDEGIKYIESYIPKEDSGEKKNTHSRPRKPASITVSQYTSITADDLNLKNYPAVKSFPSPKSQVILAMYIVVKEGKGEWFTVDDVIHLLINIFEVPANVDKVNNVFKTNKSMFQSEQDPNHKKALRRKLLSGAKDYAESIIAKSSEA